MRISDWISDVCSSDLDAPTFAAPSIQNVHHHRFFQKAVRSPQARQRIRDAGQRPGMRHDDDQNAAIAAFAALDHAFDGHARIPRGGCDFREHAGSILRSEEHTSELQSLMRISYAVFCLKKKQNIINIKLLTTLSLSTAVNQRLP